MIFRLEEELIGEDLDYEYDLDEEEEEALLAGEDPSQEVSFGSFPFSFVLVQQNFE